MYITYPTRVDVPFFYLSIFKGTPILFFPRTLYCIQCVSHDSCYHVADEGGYPDSVPSFNNSLFHCIYVTAMSRPTSPVITIFGASGFIARQLLRTLSKTKCASQLTLRLASRHATSHPSSFWRDLAPNIHDILPISCHISRPDQVSHALQGATHAVNCVGILHQTRASGASFHDVHHTGPSVISQAIASHPHLHTLVHLSAIGAREHASSVYQSTKFAGEQAALGLSPHKQVAILRPSIVFGPEDSFFNRFHHLSAYLPILPLIGGGLTRFQPVHVEDVANAILHCLKLDGGQHMPYGVYELGGSNVLTFKQLMQLVLEANGRRRLLLPLPYSIANAQASLFEAIHNVVPSIPPMLTRDQVESLKFHNTVSPNAKTLADLGIQPKPCNIDTISYIRQS